MNNKRIIEIIKKVGQADDLPDPPGVVSKPKTAPTQTPAPVQKKTESPQANTDLSDPPAAAGTVSKILQNVQNKRGISLPEVKELQKAILKFATVASATDITSLQGQNKEQQYGAQSRALPNAANELPDNPYETKSNVTSKDTEYLGGSDPFGNFITQNYIKDSFKGKQYLNVDVAGNKNRQTQSNEPMNLRGIIDSIKRIGSPSAFGSEKTVDGIWQVRTNNALHLISGLVSAMLAFVNDMKINIKGYSLSDLDKFKGMIPQSYTELKSSEETSQKALKLIPHIEGMTIFFENLKPAIFNNPEIKQFIEQKTPFAKYDKVVIPEEMKNNFIPGIKFNFIKDTNSNGITLNELSSHEGFLSFVNRIKLIKGYAENDPEAVKHILDLVYKQLNPSSSEAGY